MRPIRAVKVVEMPPNLASSRVLLGMHAASCYHSSGCFTATVSITHARLLFIRGAWASVAHVQVDVKG